jgi:hypothetical protein
MATDLAVPLVPRRRVSGPAHGALRSARRGRGGDLAGTRPYQRGDDVRLIDHRASARLSFALDRDEFVIREHFAEDATRVLLVRDRRPSMALFPSTLPWLSKPLGCATVARLLEASARRARSLFRAREDTVAHALESLALGPLGGGSFVFLVSDFLALPPEDVWQEPLERGWDVVPVVLQDPIWERSFPDVAGVVLPIWDPDAERVCPTYLTRRECTERRTANEQRFGAVIESFARLGLDPILLSHADDDSVYRAFRDWAEARRAGVRVRP